LFFKNKIDEIYMNNASGGAVVGGTLRKYEQINKFI
jgi:hypothetical protein